MWWFLHRGSYLLNVYVRLLTFPEAKATLSNKSAVTGRNARAPVVIAVPLVIVPQFHPPLILLVSVTFIILFHFHIGTVKDASTIVIAIESTMPSFRTNEVRAVIQLDSRSFR